jgi:hypothetical protein
MAVPSRGPNPKFGAGMATLRRDNIRHWTPVHLDLIVESLQTTVARALAAGGALDREIVVRYWRMANLPDPFGNGVDLNEVAEGGYEAFVSRAGGPADQRPSTKGLRTSAGAPHAWLRLSGAEAGDRSYIMLMQSWPCA